jgi:hypothetical protein
MLRPLIRTLPLAAAIVVVASTASAQAGITSNIATVTMNASKSASLTVTVTAGATQTLASITDNALNTFPAATPVVIQTQWDLAPTTGSVDLVAYFTTPAQALVNGTNFIASSLVQGRVSTGTPTSFTAFSQNAVGGVGSAGGSLLLFTETITGVNKTKTRNDNLELQLNLVGQTTAVGTYSGTLNIRAVTQ